MTKAEELKILEQIEGLIAKAGADSYIALTFKGVGEVCRNNIRDDFGDSPVMDLEEMRNMRDAEIRMQDETKQMLAESHKMCKEALDENERLRKQVAELMDERDVMIESSDGLGEIIDEQEKKIRMYEAEIAQYARGDIVAEIRLDQIRRVVIIRGLYEKFIVGTQKHITENASCPWDYMTNGWKWEDAEYCNDEEEVKKVFKEIVIAERRKECGK